MSRAKFTKLFRFIIENPYDIFKEGDIYKDPNLYSYISSLKVLYIAKNMDTIEENIIAKTVPDDIHTHDFYNTFLKLVDYYSNINGE